MASTNHTTNYSLSQFIGTDKPAWLGDYNQDMSKIDTAMKANADANATTATTVAGHTSQIAGNSADIASIQGDVTALGTRVSTLEAGEATQNTAIQNAQSDATTALTKATASEANINTLQTAVGSNTSDISTLTNNLNALTTEVANNKTELQNFEKAFELSDITTCDGSDLGLSQLSYCSGSLTLAKNSDETIYKMYGRITMGNSTASSQNIPLTAIPGLNGYYGIKTTLKFTGTIPEAYLVNMGMSNFRGTGANVTVVDESYFAVGTDGYIYIWALTINSIDLTANTERKFSYAPCVFFNSNFGDIWDENA